MKRIALWIVAVTAALGLTSSLARAENIRELVDKADMAFRAKTSAAVFEMEIKTSSFHRKYKVVSWNEDRGKKERSLLKILGPALWRGNGTLKVGNQLKLYNPKTNHISVVSASMLGDSWMGSHFTNDDLVKETRLGRHYDPSLLRRWKGSSDLGAVEYFRVALTPKRSAPVAWGRIVYEVMVHRGRVLPVKAEYYRKARQKTPVRTMTFTKFRKLGGRMLPGDMTVHVAKKPGEYTRISYKKLKLRIKIPRHKFTEQALRK